MQGIEEDDVSPGFVLCDSHNPITTGKKFDAQVVILEHKSIICAGYSAVMHIHCAAEEITVSVSVRAFHYFLQHRIVFNRIHYIFVGFDLSGRQENGRKIKNTSKVRETGSGGHYAN